MDLSNLTQLNTGGAARFNYYTITTTFDFNPQNGKEAKQLFTKVKSIIQQRAEIMDDLYFRVYKNDGSFPLAGVDSTDDGIGIFQYVFSTGTHNDGWNGAAELKSALQGALLSSDIEPKNDTFSFDKKTSYTNGFRFHAKVVQEDGSNPFQQLERARTRISSTEPSMLDGSIGDFWMFFNGNIITYYYKDKSNAWINITSAMHIGTDAPADASVNYWLVPAGMSFTKFIDNRWTEQKTALYSEIAPVTSDYLWMKHNSYGTEVFTFNGSRWVAATITAVWVLDDYTWFINPMTMELNAAVNVSTENDALVGFDVSKLGDIADPTKPDVTVKNPNNMIYVSGADSTDGSWRFNKVGAALHLQQKEVGVWNNKVIVDDVSLTTNNASVSDISISHGFRTSTALPFSSDVGIDKFGRGSTLVTRWASPAGRNELVMSNNEGVLEQRVIVGSDITNGSVMVFQPDSTYKRVYILGTDMVDSVVADLESVDLSRRLDATKLKNADKLGGGQQYRGTINVTSTMNTFKDATKGSYWVAAESFTLGGHLFNQNDEVIVLKDIIGTPVDLQDNTQFTFKASVIPYAKLNHPGIVSIVENKGIVLNEATGMFSLKTNENQFLYDATDGTMTIRVDGALVTTPAGIMLKAKGPLNALGVDGLELDTDNKLSVVDNKLTVNEPEVDVLKLKNVALLNKGNYRGYISSDPATYTDAKRGDWWKAEKDITVLTIPMGAGDEIFCVTEIVGVPTDLTHFAVVRNTSKDMTGATSAADGLTGYVPAPKAGDQDAALRGDGTWRAIPASLQIHDIALAFKKDDLVMFNGIMCKANDAIEANKPFVWGTTGATWSPLLPWAFGGVFTSGQTYQANDVVASSSNSTSFLRCVNTHVADVTLMSNWVPVTSVGSGAGAMGGASTTANGTAGLVPAPLIADESKMLSGNGAWKDPHELKDVANTTKLYKLVVENGLPYLEELN